MIKTLKEQFHCDEKMLSSSVVCLLSFTILDTFENKKGTIIIILVYSSVIDINQLDVIFWEKLYLTARSNL